MVPENREGGSLLQREQLKNFHVDDDLITVPYYYDEDAEIFIGRFPEFDVDPRYTPNGRPWKSAVSDTVYSHEYLQYDGRLLYGEPAFV